MPEEERRSLLSEYLALQREPGVFGAEQLQPPESAPRGRATIREFLRGIAAAGFGLAIERPVVDERRVAYTLTATLGDGRRVIENVILDHIAGRIIRQVDVEAWD